MSVDRVWTKEERKAAKKLVWERCGDFLSRGVPIDWAILCRSGILALQCELTAAEEEIREARELLQGQIDCTYEDDALVAIDALIERNAPESETK